MSKPRPYARIAITLPEEVLQAADAAARRSDRSRSWIIAEAVREYVARPAASAASALPLAPGLGPQRREQLVADLRLSALERVRAAEETTRVAVLRQGVGPQRVIGFDRYEDYLAWKRRADIGDL